MSAKRPSFAAFALVASIPLAVGDEDPGASGIAGCAYDRESMLDLDQRSFDQDPDGGWRLLARNDDCRLVAADLIRDYRDTATGQTQILYWHEAQLRAMSGQIQQAVELMRQTYKDASETDTIGWNHYVDATLAFLRKDKTGLLEARDALAETPKPADFRPIGPDGKPVELIWPPNLEVVDGLVACFEKSYEFAYANCSSARPPDDD